jgi:hypothetical protein
VLSRICHITRRLCSAALSALAFSLAPSLVWAVPGGFEPPRGWYELTAAKRLGPLWQVDHEQEWRTPALDERPARWHAETALSRQLLDVPKNNNSRWTMRADALHRATRRTRTPQAVRWQQRGAVGVHGALRHGETRVDLRWRGQLDALPKADNTFLTRLRARVRRRLAGRWQVGAFAEGWQGLSGFGGRWQRLRVAALGGVQVGPVTLGVSHALQLETGDERWAQLLRLACHLDIDALLGGGDG